MMLTMPTRNHHSAPRFDGKSISLSLFLEDIEQLAEECGLSQKETIKWTIRYSPSVDRELWELQDSVETGDWDQFKEELYVLYPGSKRENKYSIAKLQALINKQSSITIRDAEDYGAYRQSFLTFSCYLGNKSRLSNREISTYFLQGLEPSFRDQVQDQLKAENPKRHPDDPYTLDEITSAALFYLSCNHSEIQTISNKKENIVPELSQGKTGLIIDAIVAAITKKPNIELHQSTEGRKLQVIKKKEDIVKTRMDKQKDIQFKKEPEVSSLKKSDSNIISKTQYPYINPINDSIQTNLGRQSPDPVITIPMKFREREKLQPKILATELQNPSHDIKHVQKPTGKQNVLVLSKSIEENGKDYITNQNQQSQDLEEDKPAAKTPAGELNEDMPREAATPFVKPSHFIAECLYMPELPIYSEVAPAVIRGTTDDQKKKYLSSDKDDWFLWPEKDNPALTQDKIHSQKYLRQVYDMFPSPDNITFKNDRDKVPLTIKQCAGSLLISKARRCRLIRLFLESAQKKLMQNFTIFRGPPLSTVWPIIVGNSPQMILEGIG